MLVTVASVAVALSKLLAFNPQPYPPLPWSYNHVNTYTGHPSMAFSFWLVLLGIGPDFLLWILELSYPLLLGQIFLVLYLVFLKKKSVQIWSSQHSPSVTLKRGDNINIFSGCCPVVTRVDLQYPLLVWVTVSGLLNKGSDCSFAKAPAKTPQCYLEGRHRALNKTLSGTILINISFPKLLL